MSSWRWLPIAVGGFDLLIVVISVLMYLTGAGASAAADAIGVPAVPATIWIRSVRETGTFVNERPRMSFELHVEPDATTGLAAYEVTKKATVPFTAMGSLRVGNGFRAPGRRTGKADVDGDRLGLARLERISGADAREDAAPTTPADVSTRLGGARAARTREAKVTDEEYQAQRQRILGSL